MSMYFQNAVESTRIAANYTKKWGHGAGDFERGLIRGISMCNQADGKLEPYQYEYIKNIDHAIVFMGISA